MYCLITTRYQSINVCVIVLMIAADIFNMILPTHIIHAHGLNVACRSYDKMITQYRIDPIYSQAAKISI